MRWFARKRRSARGQPARCSSIENLDVHYGRAHALQQVSLELARGVRAVVGRNGMGKTTLCNAITGLVPARGSVRFRGEEILGFAPHAITAKGIGYVPQGRRVWPSLTVDEHLAAGCATSRGDRGRRNASTRRSRDSRSARGTAVRSFPAASSRCSRSRARCCSTPACW